MILAFAIVGLAPGKQAAHDLHMIAQVVQRIGWQSHRAPRAVAGTDAENNAAGRDLVKRAERAGRDRRDTRAGDGDPGPELDALGGGCD